MTFRLVSWIGTFIITLIVTLVGMLGVLIFGLIVAEVIIFPLALIIAAALAALSAGWAATLLARDGMRTDLWAVLGVTEAVAVIFAVVVLATLALRNLLFGPVFGIGLVSSLILTLSAVIAAGRFRRPITQSQGDIKMTIILLVLAVLSIPLVIWLASLVGLAGA
jgi:hypothetical protein